MQYDVKKGLTRNKVSINIARVLFGKLLLKVWNIKTEYYKPKHDTFIIVANHCDIFDPGVEMIALKRYIRFVASDHLLHIKVFGKAMTYLGGVIVKYRGRPSSELTGEIIENVKNGISVSIYAEGGTTFNGETGFISEHTGELVKNSGVALITFRYTGGYLKAPRWAQLPRKGQIFGKVVNEYSPEELEKLSVEEITEIIRRDTYVNAFEEQRKDMHEYKGEKLAQYVERALYICPECKKAGTMHSEDDRFFCTCGYEVTYGTDGFFHRENENPVFDNVLDWDKWQREVWKNRLLSAAPGELIFSEDGQIVYSVDKGERTLISENAEIRLYNDRFEIEAEGHDTIKIPMETISKVQTAMKDFLVIVNDEGYYDINSAVPRSATKYVAAWRYLTGKEYV